MEKQILEKGFSKLCTAKAMAELYEANFKQVSKYVHATSRGHEAIQVALGMQLLPQDYAFPYYRDDAMLLAFGLQPYDLMLQLLAKKDDPFSAGRTYYCHPSLKDADKPKIPHQSSATGMQAIPATGVAMGMQYKELQGLDNLSTALEDTNPACSSAVENSLKPITVCSLGDASVTEGEIAEAFQMAALKQMPILYLVQDNGWDISANAAETRAQNAFEYAQGFHGLEAITIDGANFTESYKTIEKVIKTIRKERRPFLVHAKVPLLNHHTSGVRMEWYRDDLDEAKSRDPYPVIKQQLVAAGFSSEEIETIENSAKAKVKADFEKALKAEDPKPEDLFTNDFIPTPITEEKGTRSPEGAEKVVMVDCALFAVEELMKKHKECLLYGQDVGGRLGGVFREA
ncbi:MAG: thiamine pyrophosphate-dependent dehydrogenase E1 component subunit alpha, partial [Winogradskyella sp.]